MMCEWIIRAWGQISDEVIKKSFKKTGISCAIDGSEDDMLWDSENENDGMLSEPDVNENSDDSDESDNTV